MLYLYQQVTSDDNGQYYCVAQKPGVTWSSGVESMPTRLSVVAGSKRGNTLWKQMLNLGALI